MLILNKNSQETFNILLASENYFFQSPKSAVSPERRSIGIILYLKFNISIGHFTTKLFGS